MSPKMVSVIWAGWPFVHSRLLVISFRNFSKKNWLIDIICPECPPAPQKAFENFSVTYQSQNQLAQQQQWSFPAGTTATYSCPIGFVFEHLKPQEASTNDTSLLRHVQVECLGSVGWSQRPLNMTCVPAGTIFFPCQTLGVRQSIN
jgi:hypothetical protein